MIRDKHFLGEQIGRLIGLKFFPTDQRGVNELVTALSFSRNEIIATATINAWLEGSSDRPTPYDLRQIIQGLNVEWDERQKASEIQVAPRNHCSKCYDFGVIESTSAADLHSIASWCTCEAATRAQKRCCSCEENSKGECGRPLDQWDCKCPPWRVNAARQKLLRLQAVIDKKQSSLGLRPVADVIADEYHGDF